LAGGGSGGGGGGGGGPPLGPLRSPPATPAHRFLSVHLANHRGESAVGNRSAFAAFAAPLPRS